MSRYPIPSTCWVCGARGEEVKLCGGYNAGLCLTHRNDWHEYAFGIATVRVYLRAVGKLDFYTKVIASPNDFLPEVKWMDAQKEAHEAGKKAFGIAKRWIERGRKKWVEANPQEVE